MKKVKRFNGGENCGFIEYKENGDVLICYSINENEYIEIELSKTDDSYNLKKYSITKRGCITSFYFVLKTGKYCNIIIL